MDRCRIAFVNVMDGYSGGEIVLKRLINGLDKNLFKPIIYTKKTRFVEMLECESCSIVIIPFQYQLKRKRGLKAFFIAIKNFFASGKYVWAMKYEQKVDIIHSNSLTSSMYFAPWAKLFGVRFIAHNHLIRYGRIYTVIYRYVGFCSDRILCVSEAVKRCWIEAGVAEDKLIVIYNGIPDDFF